MAGYKDLVKRAKVKKLLGARRWQESSDRAVARHANVSKVLVTEVRRQLIAAGLHPPRPDYRAAGAAGRGGYVFDDQGHQVKECDWLVREAGVLNRETGEMIGHLLDALKKKSGRTAAPTAHSKSPQPAPR